MPELPEVASRAKEMQEALVGKTIAEIEVVQPKCLNVTPKKLKGSLEGARLLEITYHGKWIFASTTRGHLLLNLGMGGDVFLVSKDEIPEKRQAVLFFDDGTALSFRFWWFGYIHYAAQGRLDRHSMTAKLGPNAVDISKKDFREMLRGRRGAVKSFLLNQENIAGIGNAYAHDILFLARLHPQRTIDTLSDDEIDGLWRAVRDGLVPSLKKGGAWYERDIHGGRGRFKSDKLLVGYRDGKPCPVCGTKVRKLRTGSTSSFICPKCQPLKSKKGCGKKASGGAKKTKRPTKKAAGRTKKSKRATRRAAGRKRTKRGSR